VPKQDAFQYEVGSVVKQQPYLGYRPLGFRYRIPAVLSRPKFAINWLKNRDFGPGQSWSALP